LQDRANESPESLTARETGCDYNDFDPEAKITHPSKTAKSGPPGSSKPFQKGGHPPEQKEFCLLGVSRARLFPVSISGRTFPHHRDTSALIRKSAAHSLVQPKASASCTSSKKAPMKSDCTPGGWPTLLCAFQLTIGHSWIVPLQDLSFVGWVWHFRVADPFGL
jgi:hypothetical protein